MVDLTNTPATCGHHGDILLAAMLKERGITQDEIELIACLIFHVHESVDSPTVLDTIVSALDALPRITRAYDA
jgi:hypothetical protein